MPPAVAVDETGAHDDPRTPAADSTVSSRSPRIRGVSTMEAEVPLTGGNVSAGVVRVGDTVRRQATAATPSVDALLRHLQQAGLTAAPRVLGRDGQDRQMLEYVPGTMADTMPAMTIPELARIGRIIRELHDTAASFVPPSGARWDVVILPDAEDLVCHHDLAPWNLVRDGDRWVFIDWDNAGPGSRLWDLAYAAHGFVPLSPDGDAEVDAPRLQALVDGYGLDAGSRARLPALMVARTRAMHDLLVDGAATGTQPWARLHADGHADHWGPAADYIEQHLDTWARVLSPDGGP